MSFRFSLLHNTITRIPIIGYSRHRIVTDGEGVTTLVAFHGCSLHCKYCLNPQSITNDGVWKKITPESLYQVIKIDNLYFNETGGGICFGGGEPLIYPNFIKEFKALCPSSWKISVETCLNIPYQNIVKIANLIDEFIVDIKDMNPDIYKAYTGKDNTIVKSNLQWLVSNGLSNRITVKTPIIPNFNSSCDVDRSVASLKAMGLTRFKRLTYITDRVTQKKNEYQRILVGKATCTYLRNIRIKTAQEHGIEYTPKDCGHKGPCSGTCTVCDRELKQICKQLHF